MTGRVRAWVTAATVLTAVLALLVGWGALLSARSTPRLTQTAPGATAVPDRELGMPVRLVSLTQSPILQTSRDSNPAPAGASWVVAVVEYDPGELGSSCALQLLSTDGRRWPASGSLDYEGQRTLPNGCQQTEGGAPGRAELIYLIPADAVPTLAGLASARLAYRGLAPSWVLTPP